MAPDKLNEFGIDAELGFLPVPDPLSSLPDELDFIDDYANALPRLIREERIRQELLALRPLRERHYDMMGDRRVRFAAFRNYCFFASAYVLPKAGEPAKELPEGIAIPLYLLSEWFSVPPILQYYPYALANWKRKDPDGPVIVENLENIVNFADLPDEPGFILPHVEINAKAAPAIRASLPLLEAAANGKAELAEAFLCEIGYSVQAMVNTLAKIRKYCDPEVYYQEVRPFIQKFTGVVYQGVKAYKGEPQSFGGESGAQDSNLPSLDALLGIKFNAPEDNEELKRFLYFLEEAQKYMPVGHRRFIRFLRKNSKVRQFVTTSGRRDLKEAYNFSVEKIADFRFKHLGLAIDYIHKPMPQEAFGTFGAPFMKWLNWLRESTLAHRIA